MKKNLSPLKILIFSILPLLLLLLFFELGARAFYYQTKSHRASAIMHMIEILQRKITLARAEASVRDMLAEMGFPKDKLKNRLVLIRFLNILKDNLYTPLGKELLRELLSEYEDNFRQLIREVRSVNSKMAVLYIPSVNSSPEETRVCRDFFKALSKKYDVDFIDATDSLERYPVRQVTLKPENVHLSRFGNIIVAGVLGKYLEANTSYRSGFVFKDHPAALGDLDAGIKDIWDEKQTMPYCVYTNSQGLRMYKDLAFPKRKQHILMLGDSYTFGPFLSNLSTIPAFLKMDFPDMEVINAGKSGYTITDELSLFRERAKYTEPDITVLQVLDNDIFGLLSFKKNQFDRERRSYQPTALEREYIKRILEQYQGRRKVLGKKLGLQEALRSE